MSAVAPQLIGESTLFHALLDRVSDLASLDRPILVVGERGTGKALIASRIHFLSPRWEQTYISVNCAAFTEDALEIELFGDGHTRGRVESADGGTLFLDNIDAVPVWMQERLGHLIEFGEFQAQESSIIEKVDVRCVAAVTAAHGRPAHLRDNLSTELRDRLAGHVLTLPPLRVRPDDIPSLVTYFGKKTVSALKADRFPGLTPEALGFLKTQTWPGNVRELKNTVERSVTEAFLQDESLDTPIHNLALNPFERAWEEDSPAGQSVPELPELSTQDEDQQPELETTSFTDRVKLFERSLIDQALSLHDHHQGKAADYLGLSYHQFRGLLRKHGLKK